MSGTKKDLWDGYKITIVKDKDPKEETLQEKRLRYSPGVTKGVMEQAYQYLKEGNYEQAESVLAFGIYDINRSFPDYPFDET
jgi:pimeloyl-CoA synthetase